MYMKIPYQVEIKEVASFFLKSITDVNLLNITERYYDFLHFIPQTCLHLSL